MELTVGSLLQQWQRRVPTLDKEGSVLEITLDHEAEPRQQVLPDRRFALSAKTIIVDDRFARSACRQALALSVVA
jgi:hypothetical protein